MKTSLSPSKLAKRSRQIFKKGQGSLLLLAAGTTGLLYACAFSPEPLTPSERAEIIAADRNTLIARQLPVTHPINLFEAMARALKYNLDHRVALLEKAVAQKQLDLSYFDLLPQITATGTYKSRDTPAASSGFSITDDSASDSFSTSQDRVNASGDLTLVWNVLDFGISAIQARQESDRLLISQENRRKAVHTLLQEVRHTFWRAAGAQKLASAIGPVIQEARKTLDDARQVERERLKPQLEILRFQRALLDIVRQLQELRHQLVLAKTEFASLINLPPGSEFSLDIPDDPALSIPQLHMTVEEMEQLALNNRPEIREAMYNSRISAGDVRKAMLRLLPGLEFSVSHNYDGNSFTLHNQWEEAGARVVWNLLNVLKGPSSIRLAENQEALTLIRRLTMNMAVLTQTHLAYRQYLDDQRSLKAAEEIDGIDRRILENFSITEKNDAQSRLEYIHAATSAIMSRLQLYQAYAEAQNAVGRMYVSIGVDLLPKALRSDDISLLSKALRDSVISWNEGVSAQPLQQLIDSLKPTQNNKKTSKEEPSDKTDQEISQKEHIPLSQDSSPDKIEEKPPLSEDSFTDKIEEKTPLSEDSSTDKIEEKPTLAEDTSKEDPSTHQEPASSKPSSWQDSLQKSHTKLRQQDRDSSQTVPTYFLEQKTLPDAKEKETVGEPSPEQLGPLIQLEPDETEQAKLLEEEIEKDTEQKEAENQIETDGSSDEKQANTPINPDLLAQIWNTVHSWVEAWSQRDAVRYLAFYSDQSFIPPRAQPIKVWRQRITDNLNTLKFINIEIGDLEVIQESDGLLQVLFQQKYHSDRYRGISRKLLLFGREGDDWKIHGEAFGPVNNGEETPPGFAVQVGSLVMSDSQERLQKTMIEKGFQPTMVETHDHKGRLHYSVRIAYFKEKARALLFQWSLQSQHSLESTLVAATESEMIAAGLGGRLDEAVDDSSTDTVPGNVDGGSKTVQEPIHGEQKTDSLDGNANGI